MKLVGVMGKPGSGKTTFSDYLGNKDTVGVIHVDDLVSKLKKKYFKMFLQPKENNKTERLKQNPKLKSGVKEVFYKNKILFNFLLKIRSKLVEKELLNKINEFKLEGKGIVVIDDWVLSSHKKLFSKLDYIYTMERDFLGRRDGLRKRDELTVEELRVADIPYALENVKLPVGDNVIKVSNNGAISDLENIADKEYEKIGVMSFDERYSVKNRKIGITSVAKSINNARKVTSQEKIQDKT